MNLLFMIEINAVPCMPSLINEEQVDLDDLLLDLDHKRIVLAERGLKYRHLLGNLLEIRRRLPVVQEFPKSGHSLPGVFLI